MQGQSGYYGVLTATVPAGNNTFQNAGFSFTGFVQAPSTPEPGAGALLLGAVVSSGLLAVRHRKQGKSSGRDFTN